MKKPPRLVGKRMSEMPKRGCNPESSPGDDLDAFEFSPFDSSEAEVDEPCDWCHHLFTQHYKVYEEPHKSELGGDATNPCSGCGCADFWSGRMFVRRLLTSLFPGDLAVTTMPGGVTESPGSCLSLMPNGKKSP